MNTPTHDYSRLRCLVIGTGSIGRRHIGALQQVGAVAEAYTSGRSGWQGDDRLARLWTKLEPALESRPDLAIVATPTSLHAPPAEAAIELGIPVLVEKPLCADGGRAEDICRLARNRGVMLAVGYNFRFHKGLAAVASALAQGVIGRPWSIRSQVGQYLPDWHPGEDYRSGYASRSDLGGGVIRTLSHEIDYVDWLAGGAPHALSCTATRLSDLEIDVEDTACLTIEYPGLLAEIHLDMVQRRPSRTLEIQGDRGCLTWDDMARTLNLGLPGQPELLLWTGSGSERADSFVEQDRAMLDSIQSGVSDPRFGDPLRTMRFIGLALESAGAGRRISWRWS